MNIATGDIDSVNHVGIAVRDLDAVCQLYERIGFTLTPLSMHKGSLNPGEAPVPYGTGNRCAIFGKNYLEILAWIDKDKWDFGMKHFLSRHEGAHIICFGCGDAAVVDKRVSGNDIQTSGVIPLQRDLEMPEGTRTAKFECVHFGKGFMPEGLIQAAHHLTPQYIHQDRYVHHRNGVTALSDVYLSTSDPDAFERRYEKLTGIKARRAGRRRVFDLPLVSRVSIIDCKDMAAEFPGSTFPTEPCLAGYAFAVGDLAKMAGILTEAGLPFYQGKSRVVVPASAMFGATVVFESP